MCNKTAIEDNLPPEVDTLMMRRNSMLMEKLREAAKPLVDFVNENCDPHSLVTIEMGFVRLYNGSLGFPTDVPD